MSWLRIDDGFTEHRKVIGLSDRAFRLHVAALCYCARNLTDGKLTPKAVKVVCVIVSASKRHVAELVEAELWNVASDGHAINDYLDWNPDADKVKEGREKARDRQAKSRANRRGGNTTTLASNEIAERDEWTCYLCGGEIDRGDLSIDHVVPVSRGGSDEPTNLRATHLRCNRRKNDRTLEECVGLFSHLSRHGVTHLVTHGVSHTDPVPSRPLYEIPKAVTSDESGTASDHSEQVRSIIDRSLKEAS